MRSLQTDIDPLAPPHGAIAAPQLEACAITKRYGSRVVLDGVSLSVAAGESVAIMLGRLLLLELFGVIVAGIFSCRSGARSD